MIYIDANYSHLSENSYCYYCGQQWPQEFAGYQRDLECMIYVPGALRDPENCRVGCVDLSPCLFSSPFFYTGLGISDDLNSFMRTFATES